MEYGNKDLAKKDPGQKDAGAYAIDFGTGKHAAFPTDYSGRGRADSEECYSEYAKFNSGSTAPASQPSVYRTGPLAMEISAKDNGGEKAGKSEGGM